MLTSRSYGACSLFYRTNYKHGVPTGLTTASCLLPPSPCSTAAGLVFFLLNPDEEDLMQKILALILFSFFIAGCSLLPHDAPPEDIDKATALFVQRLNAAQYDAIYKDTARKFKDNQ